MKIATARKVRSVEFGNRSGILPDRQSDELRRLRAYVRETDQVIEPVVTVSRNSIHRDGFIPGWVVVRMLRLADEGSRRKAQGPRFGKFIEKIQVRVLEIIRSVWPKRQEGSPA